MWKKAKFSKKIYQNISNKVWNIIKCCIFCRNRSKKIILWWRSKKGQKIFKWPNYFLSGKLFQKGQMIIYFFRSLFSSNSVHDIFISAVTFLSRKRCHCFFTDFTKIRVNVTKILWAAFVPVEYCWS